MQATPINWKKRTILFLISQAITVLGSSVVQMAIVWYVTLETSSGAWVSALTLCSFLPQMLISFFGGVWADRYNRKHLIILVDSVIAATTLLLALAFPLITSNNALLAGILVISIIRSLGAGVQSPAVSAMIPQLVPEEHLMRFNGINASVQSTIQFTSPAIAAAILSLGALRNVLFLDVATAVAGIGLLIAIAIPKHTMDAAAAQTPFFVEMKAGITYAFTDRLIGRLVLVFGAFIFLSVPSGFLAALLISRTFGESYLYLSIVEMTGFIGMTLGGLVIGAWGGFKNRLSTLTLGMAAYAGFSILIGLLSNFVLFTISMFFISFAIPLVQAAVTTLLQENTPADLQGRVFGLLNIAYSGFLPLGMAVFGPAADRVSVQTLIIIAGLVLCMFAMWIFARSRKENTLEQQSATLEKK